MARYVFPARRRFAPLFRAGNTYLAIPQTKGASTRKKRANRTRVDAGSGREPAGIQYLLTTAKLVHIGGYGVYLCIAQPTGGTKLLRPRRHHAKA